MKSSTDLTEKMNIQQVISKHKMNCMKKCDFEDNEVEILYDIGPDSALLAEYIEKNPLDKSTSCRREFAEHEVNNHFLSLLTTYRYSTYSFDVQVLTSKVYYENRGMNHTEGGWPKDINPADVEQTVRFKKKIEKDDTYIHSVQQLSHVNRFLFSLVFE